ncbi:uncharacterized protein LOC133780009 [Humulus lupulus]|uniref:uncharacterized protein LOC133780009 n=1 Tax=Humulus lupulus TaxID=3486 RepID=UPI002B407803|nr:uncharacterized protein LOC133780009 [Humulus lupulus]
MATTGHSPSSPDDSITSTIAGSQPIPPSSNTRMSLEDPSDPYYLHHSDDPGNNLVSQLLTGQDNYASWSRSMKLSISVKNKIGFLDGSITKPSPTDTSLYIAWSRNNNIVISWILNSVSKEISASILYDDSASEIWKDLQVRFQRSNGPHIFNLQKDLTNLRQDSQTVSMYYTKLRTIWEELSTYRPTCTCNKCTCGGVQKLQEHYHMEYIMSFLMRLKDSYSHVRGNIFLMDPLPELNRVFHFVTQEENQRGDLTIDSHSSMAFALQSDWSHTLISDSTTCQPHPPRKNHLFAPIAMFLSTLLRNVISYMAIHLVINQNPPTTHHQPNSILPRMQTTIPDLTKLKSILQLSATLQLYYLSLPLLNTNNFSTFLLLKHLV